MKPKLTNVQGWTEVVIYENCEWAQFHDVADILQGQFDIAFTKKLHDFDSAYWDFEFKSANLTLHYNVYIGITIFPSAFGDATKKDNEYASEIGHMLFNRLHSQ